MSDGETLVEAALRVLNTADPVEKAKLGDQIANNWLQGLITNPYLPSQPELIVPDRPARLSNVKLVSPSLMSKLGKAGSLQSRQAIVHSLVHTESWAIDLSWDIIARFGKQESMPREFFNDFVRVAQDEGRHFTLLAARIEELGSFYGALPAHDGLWDSAVATSKDLFARLAVEHCVHEVMILHYLFLQTFFMAYYMNMNDRQEDLMCYLQPSPVSLCFLDVLSLCRLADLKWDDQCFTNWKKLQPRRTAAKKNQLEETEDVSGRNCSQEETAAKKKLKMCRDLLSSIYEF